MGASSFPCSALAGPGTFTVPAAILSALPASGISSFGPVGFPEVGKAQILQAAGHGVEAPLRAVAAMPPLTAPQRIGAVRTGPPQPGSFAHNVHRGNRKAGWAVSRERSEVSRFAGDRIILRFRERSFGTLGLSREQYRQAGNDMAGKDPQPRRIHGIVSIASARGVPLRTLDDRRPDGGRGSNAGRFCVADSSSGKFRSERGEGGAIGAWFRSTNEPNLLPSRLGYRGRRTRKRMRGGAGGYCGTAAALPGGGRVVRS